MKFDDYPIIICGSGASIPYNNETGLPEELKSIIESNVSIGINWFNYFGCDTTFLTFVDNSLQSNFITKAFKKGDWLDHIPLCIGRYSKVIEPMINKNMILVPASERFLKEHALYFNKKVCVKCGTKYDKKQPIRFCEKCNKVKLWDCGVFPSHLSGLFSLSLAISLGFKEIYLLGLDCTDINNKTHFYQDKLDQKEVNKNGIFNGVGTEIVNGKKQYRTGTYKHSNKDKINCDESRFGAFSDWAKWGIKIYNVSLVSTISLFPKLDYNEFYELIGYQSVNQDEIRKEIKQFLVDKQKM